MERQPDRSGVGLQCRHGRSDPPAAGTIEIVLPNRTTVRVDAQIDPRALRRVLSVLAKP
jgi:hypothetical protein